MDAFDDIDLSISGPRLLRTEGPEARPAAACAGGHVHYIEDEESTVVHLLALQAQTGAAVRSGVLAVYIEVDVVSGYLVETLREGVRLV